MVNFFRWCSVCFYITAFIFLISGGASFFYKEVVATTIEPKEFYVMRGKAFQNASSETGSNNFLFLSYTYTVNNSNLYKGYWLKIWLNYKNKYDNKAFYNPLVPMISVKEKGISIFWVAFLLLIGFISNQISKFFAYLNKHT